MKESIGYTVSLNIMIVFITIIIAFLCAALIYFKSNKVSNVITNEIEKYEGHNSLSTNEINKKLRAIGYFSRPIDCHKEVEDDGAYDGKCSLVYDGVNGYCVYVCYEENKFDVSNNNKYIGEYYYYKIRTNMMINIPIINNLLDIPIYSNTNRLYNFEK